MFSCDPIKFFSRVHRTILPGTFKPFNQADSHPNIFVHSSRIFGFFSPGFSLNFFPAATVT